MLLAFFFFALSLALPIPRLTPGVATTLSVRQICSRQWGLDRRHVTPAMKREVCERYGAKDCPGPMWEIDHLIPRELGGADAVKNLWPQPIDQARIKDSKVERVLHNEVCARSIRLDAAQKEIAADWTTFLK